MTLFVKDKSTKNHSVTDMSVRFNSESQRMPLVLLLFDVVSKVRMLRKLWHFGFTIPLSISAMSFCKKVGGIKKCMH